MNSPDMWLNQAPDNKRFAAAIAAGLLLELAALALALPMVMQQPPPAQIPAPVKITIVAPPAPKPPPPAPKPPPPKPVTPPLPKTIPTPPKPLPPPPRRAVAHNIIHHAVPPRPIPPAPPQVVPPPPQTPPAPPVPQAPSQGEVDLFRLAMKEAVQAVANEVYPQAAQMAHESGSAGVTFTYQNGIVTNITLAHTSGYPLLDAAALQAAHIAHYPPPPAGFTGRVYSLTVELTFQLAAPSVDGD